MKRPIPQRLVTIIFLGVCIVLNILIQKIPLRLDFSNGQAYSISNASQKVISSLKQPAKITFFSSGNIPSELKSTKQDVNDFLKEYSSQDNGKKISYQVKDPSSDTTAQNEVVAYNIPALQFSQQDQDRFAMQTAYFGIGIEHNGKRASIPQATNLLDLEYNLTTALYKMSVEALPRVGVMGQADGISQLQTLTQVTQSQFEVEESSSPRPQYKAMLVFGTNTKSYTSEELEAIKTYLKQGGFVLFLVDGVSVDDSLAVNEQTHNLFNFLGSLGVEINKDLLLSRAAELVSFAPTDAQQGQNTLPTVLPYPYWVKTNEFEDDVLFSNVDVVVFPWTSTTRPSSSVKTLVFSEPQSWTQTQNFNLNPQEISPQGNVKEKTYPLITQGSLGKGTFVVIPSSRFILDQYLSRTSDNLELVINVLSEYTSGGAFSGIRRRSVEYYPLPQLSEEIKNVIKYSQILVGPLLFTLVGIFWLVRRSRSRI